MKTRMLTVLLLLIAGFWSQTMSAAPADEGNMASKNFGITTSTHSVAINLYCRDVLPGIALNTNNNNGKDGSYGVVNASNYSRNSVNKWCVSVMKFLKTMNSNGGYSAANMSATKAPDDSGQPWCTFVTNNAGNYEDPCYDPDVSQCVQTDSSGSVYSDQTWSNSNATANCTMAGDYETDSGAFSSSNMNLTCGSNASQTSVS